MLCKCIIRLIFITIVKGYLNSLGLCLLDSLIAFTYFVNTNLTILGFKFKRCYSRVLSSVRKYLWLKHYFGTYCAGP